MLTRKLPANTYVLYYCILRSRCVSTHDEARRRSVGESMARPAVHWTLLIVTALVVVCAPSTPQDTPHLPGLARTVLYSSMYMSRSLAALHSCSHDGPLAMELTLSHEVKCVGLVIPHARTRHLPSGPQPPSHHRTRSLNEKFLFLLHHHSNTNIRTPTFAHRPPHTNCHTQTAHITTTT